MVAYQQYGAQPSTTAQYNRMGQMDSLVVAQPPAMETIGPPLKAANPHIVLLVYENGMYAGNNDPKNLPESWYLHSKSDHRIFSRGNGGSLMNPLSTAGYKDSLGTVNGWAQYIAQQCLHHQASYTSGCYLDMLGPSGNRTDFNTGGAVPMDPRTGKPFIPAAYERMTGSMASVTRAALPAGKTVVGNGYLTGYAYYHKATSVLNGYTDGAQAQAWINKESTQITSAAWVRLVQMVIDNRRAGSSMFVRAHCMCPSPTRASVDRIFDLATYLLANTGHAFYDFTAGKGTIHAWQQWVPLFDLNLGAPTQTYATVGKYFLKGVYQRAYHGGLVLVNPGPKPVRVALPHVYHTLGGDTTTAVTVAAHGAIILKT